jgi:WD40 repeat protein
MPPRVPDSAAGGAAETCARCHAEIPAGAPFGQCPQCLLNLGTDGWLLAAIGVDLLDPTQVRSFGDYELLEEIARGGMGVVYRARQRSLGREVALKMILAGELATVESLQRFRNEAAAAARLDHPNIVSVYEIGEYETQHYFSMRLVLGRRDVAVWAQAVAASPQQRAAMMAKVARAVAFAHERGVLHRDLKPSNILVDEKGEPQVTDFGLAKLLTEHDSALTQSAMLLGSPSYMAPEQAGEGGGDVTTATDIYGLGAVIYELFAGRPPFVAASPLATVRLVVEEMPAPLGRAPRDLATICLKCLAKVPAQRYASAHALAEDLERFTRGEPIRARAVTIPEAVWRWARRRPKIAALLAALLVTFVVGFAGVFWQWRRAEHSRALEAFERTAQEEAVDHLRWMEIANQAEGDEAPLALARIAALLRLDPRRWQAAMLAMSLVDQRAFPVLAGPPASPEVKITAPPHVSPDGSWYAAAVEGNGVRAWDSRTGAEIARFALATPATAIAVAQGPIRLVIATQNGQIAIHPDIRAGATMLPRTGQQPAAELRFSSDGSTLIARSADRVEIWPSNALGPPQTLTLDGEILGAAISADGSRVLAWTGKRAAVWDAGSGQALVQCLATETMHTAVLSADGRRAAMADEDFMIRVWDVPTGKLVRAVGSPLTPVIMIALNRDGTRLTIGGRNNDLIVHDVDSGLVVSPTMRHLYNPTLLSASPDGNCLLSWGRDGRGCRWDAATGRSLGVAIWMQAEMPMWADLSTDGATVLLCPQTGQSGISVWRRASTRPPQETRVPPARDFNACRISPDGRLGCLGLCPINRDYIYELATGRVLLDVPMPGDVYLHLFSPDGLRYYALTDNGWIYGWSLETGQELWPPHQEAGEGEIRPGEISADGTRIIAGFTDGHIRIYDTATGQVVHVLDEPGWTKTLRFAPDGSGRFVSGSDRGAVHLWDVYTGALLRTFTGHTAGIGASAWSPDSRYLATASYDQTARVWDAATGRLIGRPLPHLAWLSHLEFSPDGRLLATACRDGTVRLWDPLTSEPKSPPLPQNGTAETVRFTRDGKCFVVRDTSGFRFWDTENAEPATVHYPDQASGGLAMDSEGWRAILSPDSTQVFLGYSTNQGALWTIPQPRAAVPTWFPEFLETLALLRSDDTGTTHVISGEAMFGLRSRIEREGENEYARWALRVLGGQ